VEKETEVYIKNIWVYGVGGVGGAIGGRLAGFLESHETDIHLYFIARGEHLKEIRENGLILNTSEKMGQICRPTLATERIDDLPTPDLCFVCVKSYDLEKVSNALANRIKDESVIVPLLNGVDVYDRLRRVSKSGYVLPACIYVGTHIERPGVVTQKGGEGRILLGKDPQHPEFYPDEILRFLAEADIPFSWFEDSFPAIWEKYVFIAAFGLVTAASRKTIGQVMDDRMLTQRVRGIMEEICLIAERKRIQLPPDIVRVSIEKANNFPPETKTSYQRDLELPGKPDEGDLFGGAIIGMGREFGIPTPTTESVYRTIIER
jgi:2-dehydropantoate 2-reductase